ncbi:putative protein [Arabidopsis thaliana]|uniref:Putative pumilio homolog 21 n=2 Tax=Arabidopsis TaxID=3701 RepID=PUM21_ARATH|nr:pumilio 21 [Arabidopsis thaliana]Q9LXC5.1 RecName: Full=Putative pumilio homolog 21; Short=APUM-21; Short=AtPUM21 [Arabidopsis thaliana]KAG7608662.1 Pumilio RNA-binding repeat [Arabidopsis suecica]AED91417.1 pumilio 21 [Arabidopsis thaliana]BAB09516.1 unnamed protein product [Arabidopsis thaliana]CAB89369.1 putative protein [Arabidopsis thaliana]|eukprot:NP_196523.1 pumilio 21 [Arabidopsis thaliana]
MADDNGKNPMPNDRGYDTLLTAFNNLKLYANYNHQEPGESGNTNINSNNNHPNPPLLTAFKSLKLYANKNNQEPGESGNTTINRNKNHPNPPLVTAFNNLELYANYNHQEPGESGTTNINNNNPNPPLLTAFDNLRLYANYNHQEPGESSNNNYPNLNVYNVGHISAASFNAPPFTPSSLTQPDDSSSRYSGKPFPPPPLSFVSPGVDKDRNWLSSLLDMMTCAQRFTEFQKYLQDLDTYPTAERESHLFKIGSALTTTKRIFLHLATNQYGSQALRILFRRSPSLDHLLFCAVDTNFFLLMSDKYGRGLIIPAIRAVDKTKKESLYKLTYEYTLHLARLETGCLALNNVLQEIRGIYRDLIFECVANNADWLSFDPYGTHVVQNILILQNPVATTAIAERLRGSFFRLAMERQGSYVVEKCLKSDFARDQVLEEFRGNAKEWVRMTTDKFGNFVVQSALRVMKEKEMRPLLREFVEKLRPHFGKMEIGRGRNTLRVIQEEIVGWINQLPDKSGYVN